MADIWTLLDADRLRHPQGQLAIRLQNLLRKGVDDGIFAPGEALPAERVIAERTAVSRVTVRRAIDALVEEGLLYRRRGSGTFVTGKAAVTVERDVVSTTYCQSVARRSPVTRSERLEAGVFDASNEEILALGITMHAPVSRLADLCFAGKEPVAIVRSAVPASLVPDPELFAGTVDDTLERLGSPPDRAFRKISACTVKGRDAALLCIPEGSLGLAMETVSYLPSGKPAAFTRSIYRGDAYDCLVELRFPFAPSAGVSDGAAG